MIRLVCTEDGASKFWEAAVEADALTTRWGKLGTDGQSKTKSFSSAAAAEKELAKLIKEKRAKGYVDDDAAKKTTPATAKAPKEAHGKTPAPPAPSKAKGEGERSRHGALTDAGIIALFDAAHFPTIQDHPSWEAELVEDAGIQARIDKGHLVPLSAGTDGRFTMDIVLGDALSPDDQRGVEETSKPYLFVVEKGAYLGGLEHIHASPDAKSVSAVGLAKGRYAVTVHSMKGKGRANVLALVRKLDAKESFQGRKEIAPYDPKPKEELKVIKTQKHCQRAALMGRTDEAIVVLTTLADEKGEIPAAASLAEIYAYRGDWARFIPRAVAVMQNTREVVGNTSGELPWLLVLAGLATGDWKEIARGTSEKQSWTSQKYLAAQVTAKGKAEVLPYKSSDRHKEPLEVRRARYEKWMDPSAAKKGEGPDERAKSEFLYAYGSGFDEIALEKLPRALKKLSWHQALDAARLLVDHGRAEDGWSLIEQKLPEWWPVSYAQVAPLELLCDERIRSLMTPARLAKILATRRGPEAS